MNKIIIEAHNPKWKKEFEKAKIFYLNLLKDLDCNVVHVGSTSIEGLWAKPILDIDIIINSPGDSTKAISLLKDVGYTHLGCLGIEGREAFKYSKDNKNINWMNHHLYLCLKDNENLRNHLLLKKHLLNNKEAVDKYSRLKLELAQEYPNDIDSYIDGKTDLINSFLQAEGMKPDELIKIELINKKD